MLNDQERDALKSAGPLLQFAAESKSALPPDLTLTITQSWAASQSPDAKDWTPQIASNFWIAYNKLCALVDPVSVDSINMNEAATARPRWQIWSWGQAPVSVPVRVANFYTTFLGLLLLAAILLGLIVNYTTAATKEIHDLIDPQEQAVTNLRSEIATIESKFVDADFKHPTLIKNVTLEDMKSFENIRGESRSIQFAMLRAIEKTAHLSNVLFLGVVRAKDQTNNDYDDTNVKELQQTVNDYYDKRDAVVSVLQFASLEVSVINMSVLPIVLGLMGACAFISRQISEQIRSTTFLSSSPIRNWVRLFLGGLAGVVIGYGGIIANGTTATPLISTAALAFIAGYAIEPVFALFDKIAANFRNV